LDEHRAKFMPNFTRHWDENEDDGVYPDTSDAALADMQGLPAASPDPMNGLPMNGSSDSIETKASRDLPERKSTKEEQFEAMVNKSKGRKTDSLEVWFAGAHTVHTHTVPTVIALTNP
jgi:hypothetical protein